MDRLFGKLSEGELSALRAQAFPMIIDDNGLPWYVNKINYLERVNKRMLERLKWYVDNDDTNLGQPGNEAWEDNYHKSHDLVYPNKESKTCETCKQLDNSHHTWCSNQNPYKQSLDITDPSNLNGDIKASAFFKRALTDEEMIEMTKVDSTKHSEVDINNGWRIPYDPTKDYGICNATKTKEGDFDVYKWPDGRIIKINDPYSTKQLAIKDSLTTEATCKDYLQVQSTSATDAVILTKPEDAGLPRNLTPDSFKEHFPTKDSNCGEFAPIKIEREERRTENGTGTHDNQTKASGEK